MIRGMRNVAAGLMVLAGLATPECSRADIIPDDPPAGQQPPAAPPEKKNGCARGESRLGSFALAAIPLALLAWSERRRRRPALAGR